MISAEGHLSAQSYSYKSYSYIYITCKDLFICAAQQKESAYTSNIRRNTMHLKIREARSEDAVSIQKLNSDEMGYSIPFEQAQQKLIDLLVAYDHSAWLCTQI